MPLPPCACLLFFWVKGVTLVNILTPKNIVKYKGIWLKYHINLNALNKRTSNNYRFDMPNLYTNYVIPFS